jgi:hypothetical protein
MPSYLGTVVFITNDNNSMSSERLWQHTVMEVLILLNSQNVLYHCNVPENYNKRLHKDIYVSDFVQIPKQGLVHI